MLRLKPPYNKKGGELLTIPTFISYGERFLFVDLGITGQFIGAERGNYRIAIEIKELRGKSPMVELEQAMGQYTLYRLLLAQVDPERSLYLAVSTQVYKELFQEPIGKLVIRDLPLNLLIVDVETVEVKQWIPRL
nr:element excision factor XisH family protein [Roseofilum halophilum]